MSPFENDSNHCSDQSGTESFNDDSDEDYIPDSCPSDELDSPEKPKRMTRLWFCKRFAEVKDTQNRDDRSTMNAKKTQDYVDGKKNTKSRDDVMREPDNRDYTGGMKDKDSRDDGLRDTGNRDKASGFGMKGTSSRYDVLRDSDNRDDVGGMKDKDSSEIMG